MNQILRTHVYPSGVSIQIIQGDLTLEEVDAIVNAANACLQHGGGVAGAISRKGGPTIQADSNAWVREHGPVSHSKPAYTRAGELPCRYVIHSVGPVWGEGNEEKELHSAILGSLSRADELDLSSVAMPAISTGIFGFPKERAASIILQAIQAYFIQTPESHLELVRLTLFDRVTVDVFLSAWKELGLDNEA